MEQPAYHKHDNSQIRSSEAKENGQAGSNADQLCSGRVRGETGRSIPDLPKWRSLNKYPSSPLRSHDHRKAAIKRLSECNSDRWSGLVETILRSPVSLRAPHTENTVGSLSRDVHHLVRMAGVN